MTHDRITCPLCNAAGNTPHHVAGPGRNRKGRYVASPADSISSVSLSQDSTPLRESRRRIWAASIEALMAENPLGLGRSERELVYGRISNLVSQAGVKGWLTTEVIIRIIESEGPVKTYRAAATARRILAELR